MDNTKCEYFKQEDVTGWHNDVFDHPSYKCFCSKNGEKRDLLLPETQCRRCLSDTKERN